MLDAVLRERSLSSTGLGALLAGSNHREQVEAWAAEGVTPALVALLSSDGTGALRLLIPHGWTFPVLEFEPEMAGHA